MKSKFLLFALLTLGLIPWSSENAFSADLKRAPSKSPFAIQVVDEQTTRGVPLVELKTIHNVSYWTDSAGIVAFDEPGSMGREIFFHVSSPGYEFPKDYFGHRGVRLTPLPGASTQ